MSTVPATGLIGVTGATGQLGRKVIHRLRTQVNDARIVAIVRDPAKAADLGVAARPGDYADTAALEQAFAGLDRLLLISSSSLATRKAEHDNVIRAARRAGVRHLVYTSLLHADQWGIGFADDHLATERWLRESGMDATVLRNGWYFENHTAHLRSVLDAGVMVSSAGQAPIGWASRQDYADAAAAVLTQAGHEGRTYELAGDHAHTLDELAAETARQGGKAVAHRVLTEAEHAGVLESMGLPPAMAAAVAEIEGRGVAKGVLRDDSGTLRSLIGRPTTTLQAAVADALG